MASDRTTRANDARLDQERVTTMTKELRALLEAAAAYATAMDRRMGGADNLAEIEATRAAYRAAHAAFWGMYQDTLRELQEELNAEINARARSRQVELKLGMDI